MICPKCKHIVPKLKVYAVIIDFLDGTELVGLSSTMDYAKIIRRRLRKNVEGMKVDIVEMTIGEMESMFL
jgi:hypothetical protein